MIWVVDGEVARGGARALWEGPGWRTTIWATPPIRLVPTKFTSGTYFRYLYQPYLLALFRILAQYHHLAHCFATGIEDWGAHCEAPAVSRQSHFVEPFTMMLLLCGWVCGFACVATIIIQYPFVLLRGIAALPQAAVAKEPLLPLPFHCPCSNALRGTSKAVPRCLAGLASTVQLPAQVVTAHRRLLTPALLSTRCVCVCCLLCVPVVRPTSCYDT